MEPSSSPEHPDAPTGHVPDQISAGEDPGYKGGRSDETSRPTWLTSTAVGERETLAVDAMSIIHLGGVRQQAGGARPGRLSMPSSSRSEGTAGASRALFRASGNVAGYNDRRARGCVDVVML